jgi:LysR family glycine cleavage system transcriptional activator
VQTQGAISHQIRELESRLDMKLFNREGRGITLSEAGRIYLPFVREALGCLRDGERALHPSSAENVLTVSCSPNFAQPWPVPGLGSFYDDNPSIDLRISASPQHVSFADDGIDIAVRHGDGHWPELAVSRLCEEWLFPVCSPHLVPDISSIESIDDLRGYVLIHDQQRDGWACWLQANGAEPSDFDLDRGPQLSQTSLAIDAAVSAQGIALARSALVGLDLAAGRRVRPLSDELQADFAYWIVCPHSQASEPKISRFREWLLAKAYDPATHEENADAVWNRQ